MDIPRPRAWLILFLAVFFSTLTQIQGQTSEGPAAEERVITQGHEIHEQIEQIPKSDQKGWTGFFLSWARALNPRHYVMNAVRSYFMERNLDNRALWHDVLFLFSISHPLEMALGPVLVMMGVEQGWHASAIAAGGILGGMISIPGLDPLCALTSGFYLLPKASPSGKRMLWGFVGSKAWRLVHSVTVTPYRALTRSARLVLWGGASLLIRATGLPMLYRYLRPSEPRLMTLIREFSLLSSVGLILIQPAQDSPESLSFKFQNPKSPTETLLELIVQKSLKTSEFSLKKIRIRRFETWAEKEGEFIKSVLDRAPIATILQKQKAFLKTVARPFGRNSFSAVMEAWKKQAQPSQIRDRFFVEDVQRHGDFIEVVYADGAIHLSKSRSWRGSAQNLREWTASSTCFSFLKALSNVSPEQKQAEAEKNL